MPFQASTVDREHDKFVECPTGETSVRVCVANDSSDPVQVSGSFGAAAGPTGPFQITVVTVTDVATNPLTTNIPNRVSLSIRNRDLLDTVYFGKNALVTADDTATGGWEIGPNEDFNIDLDDSNNFFLITTAGQTALVKILEVASTGSGGSVASRKQEPLIGVVDGVNVTFTVTQLPLSDDQFELFQDGILQRNPTHYTRSGSTITMVTAPVSPQELDAVYDY